MGNFCQKNKVVIKPEKYTDDTINKIEKYLNKIPHNEVVENLKLPSMGERYLVAKNKQRRFYSEYYIEYVEII